MKKTIKHYHFTLNGKNILCAAEYEDHLKQYDVSIWCDNQNIGRIKMKSLDRNSLNQMVKLRVKNTAGVKNLNTDVSV